MIEPAAIHRTSVAHIRLFRKLIQSKAFLASHIQYGMQNTNLTRMPHGVYYKIRSPYLEWPPEICVWTAILRRSSDLFYVATEGSMYLGIGVLPTSAELAPVSGKFSVSSNLPEYVSLAKVIFAFL